MKKVGKTTRPFRYGLNQIPYNDTVEMRHRFKGLDHELLTAKFRLKLKKVGKTSKPFRNAAAAAAKSLQSCPTLCDPIDGRPPGSPIPGILQATLEWGAIAFSEM